MMDITERVRSYLAVTERKYFPGQDEYYARVALAQALRAFEEGNYGIGAVAIVVSDDHVQEFCERNAMITGVGVVDHAETRALLRIGKTQECQCNWPESKTSAVALAKDTKPSSITVHITRN
jgi:tRNA(Arg) A34 adenosine deaminase TadA